MLQDNTDTTPRDIRHAAMDLLARREHSRRELSEKLFRRFPFQQTIDEQLDRLEQDGLLSDERFVESFVNYRYNSGKGPLRILQELKQKGIDQELIDAYVDPKEEHWRECAQQVLQKKFGADKASSPAEKAKRARFLQYRGFTSEQVFRLL
jgi:regulatory protein